MHAVPWRIHNKPTLAVCQTGSRATTIWPAGSAQTDYQQRRWLTWPTGCESPVLAARADNSNLAKPELIGQVLAQVKPSTTCSVSLSDSRCPRWRPTGAAGPPVTLDGLFPVRV